jgi:predicted translin family RNA/ssDNA-binding protein
VVAKKDYRLHETQTNTAPASLRALNQSLPPNISKSNTPYYTTISSSYAAISNDLQNLNAHRYARQISGGHQEYIEAASFEHYLTTASLLTYEDAVAKVRALDAEGPGVGLGFEDYVLGIYDMTGELMRFAITAMATSGELPRPEANGKDAMEVDSAYSQRTILTDLRQLRSALESLNTSNTGPFGKEADKKADVMRQSVEKVERALYGLTVRGAERPKGWMPDLSEGSRAVEVEG